MDERPDDLTEGWPEEPTNEELARFAERLRAARPALSHEALGRVEAAMRREMAARPKARRRRWATLAASLAAAVLLALGVHLHLRPGKRVPVPTPTMVASRTPAAPTGARDSYTVRFAAPPAAVPAGPLLSLLDYETLYADLR